MTGAGRSSTSSCVARKTWVAGTSSTMTIDGRRGRPPQPRNPGFGSSGRLPVGARHPGDAGELDPLIGQRFRLFRAGLAVDPPPVALPAVDPARLLGKFRADIVAVLLDLGRIRCSIARICAGMGPPPTAAGAAGGCGAATGTGSASRLVATAGRISARSTLASPQCGHSSMPRFASWSNAALSLYQPSNACPSPQRKS